MPASAITPAATVSGHPQKIMRTVGASYEVLLQRIEAKGNDASSGSWTSTHKPAIAALTVGGVALPTTAAELVALAGDKKNLHLLEEMLPVLEGYFAILDF